jgi:histone H2B
LKLAEDKWPMKKKNHHPFFISPAATEKRGWHVPPQQPSLDHLHQPLSASTRAHAPQAISNPLTATRAQLQKPNPPPDLLVSPSTSISQQHLFALQQLNQRTSFYSTESINHSTFFTNPLKSFEMAPKAADKKPASKAPATASKAPEKKDAGKKTAASGDKKKRSKSRKETYSSYIYKGESQSEFNRAPSRVATKRVKLTRISSPQAGPPRHWYLQPRHVHPELFRQRYVSLPCLVCLS